MSPSAKRPTLPQMMRSCRTEGTPTTGSSPIGGLRITRWRAGRQVGKVVPRREVLWTWTCLVSWPPRNES